MILLLSSFLIIRVFVNSSHHNQSLSKVRDQLSSQLTVIDQKFVAAKDSSDLGEVYNLIQEVINKSADSL